MLEPSSSDDDSDNEIARDEFDGVSTRSTTSTIDNSRTIIRAGGSFSSNRSETNSGTQRSPSIVEHSISVTPSRTQSNSGHSTTSSAGQGAKDSSGGGGSSSAQRPASPSPSLKNEREKVRAVYLIVYNL